MRDCRDCGSARTEGYLHEARPLRHHRQVSLQESPCSIPETTFLKPYFLTETKSTIGEKLNGLLRGRVRKWSSYIVSESDLMAWRVGGPCTFLPSEVTRNERSFEKERQRTSRQREWTAKHPFPCRGRGVAGEWDQLPRVSIEEHGGGCFLPTHKVPHAYPDPRWCHLRSFKSRESLVLLDS